jgi:probable phosphoglycerate mutase
MLKLYIVRHGETEFNVQKRMQGRLDSPLTQRGVDNARALARQMENVTFEKIYSSPSPRAYKTAELIKGERDIQIQIEDELREMNLADWEGKSKEELEQLYPEENDKFWNKPQLFKPIGGESFQQVQDRVVEAINKLISKNSDGNILIVTHSVVIKTLITFYMKYPMERLWENPYIYDTSVTLLTAQKGETRLELMADISHIL